jgi:RNA recognition motif-containing protein
VDEWSSGAEASASLLPLPYSLTPLLSHFFTPSLHTHPSHSAMESPPSQTLYINNINEKIKKPVLKKVLHSLFSQYGRVSEIVACKGLKLRGQAWVVYQDTASATNAMRRLQGFNLYDKPMVSE